MEVISTDPKCVVLSNTPPAFAAILFLKHNNFPDAPNQPHFPTAFWQPEKPKS